MVSLRDRLEALKQRARGTTKRVKRFVTGAPRQTTTHTVKRAYPTNPESVTIGGQKTAYKNLSESLKEKLKGTGEPRVVEGGYTEITPATPSARQRLAAAQQKIQTARRVIGQGTGVFYQAFTGRNPNVRKRGLTKAEKKELKRQGYSKAEVQAIGQQGYGSARGPREPSKLVRAKARRESMGYQASGDNQPRSVESQRSVSSQGSWGGGVVQQPRVIDPFSTDAFLPVTGLSSQRTVYLEEPERFKTHRSYELDMIGKESKKGAFDYRYDLEAMFR